jgi:hypothetical protein
MAAVAFLIDLAGIHIVRAHLIAVSTQVRKIFSDRERKIHILNTVCLI